jgi:hypothetical protein
MLDSLKNIFSEWLSSDKKEHEEITKTKKCVSFDENDPQVFFYQPDSEVCSPSPKQKQFYSFIFKKSKPSQERYILTRASSSTSEQLQDMKSYIKSPIKLKRCMSSVRIHPSSID